MCKFFYRNFMNMFLCYKFENEISDNKTANDL